MIKIILPVIFINYVFSITFFTHSHIVDGVTIVHSHPYQTDDDGKPDHTHTGSELQLIHNLSAFHAFYAIILLVFLALFTKKTREIIIQTTKDIPLRYAYSSLFLRPPPVFVK